MSWREHLAKIEQAHVTERAREASGHQHAAEAERRFTRDWSEWLMTATRRLAHTRPGAIHRTFVPPEKGRAEYRKNFFQRYPAIPDRPAQVLDPVGQGWLLRPSNTERSPYYTSHLCTSVGYGYYKPYGGDRTCHFSYTLHPAVFLRTQGPPTVGVAITGEFIGLQVLTHFPESGSSTDLDDGRDVVGADAHTLTRKQLARIGGVNINPYVRTTEIGPWGNAVEATLAEPAEVVRTREQELLSNQIAYWEMGLRRTLSGGR